MHESCAEIKSILEDSSLTKTHITSVVAMLLAVLYSVGLIAAAPGHAASPADENKPSSGVSTEYENRLFDTGTVHTVEIRMNTGVWNDLKDNALYKEYHDCNV